MATRDYDFITGPETSTLPTATTPTVSTDIVTKGYVDGFLGQADYMANGFTNGTISASVSSGDLTIALKTFAGTDATINDVIGIAFRSSTATTGTYTVPTVTAALSLTISEEINYALQGSVTRRLWVYAINNSGTVKLGASLFAYKDSLVQSTVGPSGTFTVDTGTNVVTSTGHGLETGDIITVESSGTLPSGISVDTPYWVTVLSANTFYLGAEPGIVTGFGSTGTGTHTLYPAGPRIVSDAVYSSKAVRLLGWVEATHAGAGTGWNAVTKVHTGAHNELLPDVVEVRTRKNSGNHATSGSNLVVTWDGIVRDSHAIMAGVVSTGKVSIQIPGIYEILAVVTFTNNATGNRRNRIIDDSGTVYAASSYVAGHSSVEMTTISHNVVSLAKAITLKVDALQDSGGSLNYSTVSSANLTYFSIKLIKSDI